MFTGLPMATPVVFARQESVASDYLNMGLVALQGTRQDIHEGQKPWFRSAPHQTSYAKHGKRPGAEVGHQDVTQITLTSSTQVGTSEDVPR